MPKNVHVHLHEAATRDSDDGEGRWVTINGAHVHIGKGGKIDKGPAALAGKSEHEAHAHGHDERAEEHKRAAKEKGDAHPDSKAHKKAAAAHAMAARHFKTAHAATERGDLREAAMSHKAGEREARQAQAHEASFGKKPLEIGHEVEVEGTSVKGPITHIRHDINGVEPPKYKVGGKYWNEGSVKSSAAAGKFEKPKAHVALHSEAEDDVRGSEKHEAEHKRLVGLYDKSGADWERQAANRLIQKNATEAVQHKAQRAHHEALAASEYAKRTGSPEDHRNASEHLQRAIEAHGRAGGVGYAAKQAELQKAKKEHDREAAKAGKATPKAPNLTPRQAMLREQGSPRYAGRSAESGALDRIAARVVKKGAEQAADQDPKKQD